MQPRSRARSGGGAAPAAFLASWPRARSWPNHVRCTWITSTCAARRFSGAGISALGVMEGPAPAAALPGGAGAGPDAGAAAAAPMSLADLGGPMCGGRTTRLDK
jgi:hypothetical protein